MIEKQIQPIFQLCSYLLSYPDEDFVSSLKEVEKELAAIDAPPLTDELEQFCKKAMEQSLLSLVATYIATFDFGKKTNLYISYLGNGEQRERGMDLLFLKNYYKMHGFHVTDKELPDFLPVVLEFASQVDAEVLEPIIKRYSKSIYEIALRLNEEENIYSHIFQTIVTALNMLGMEMSESEVKEIV